MESYAGMRLLVVVVVVVEGEEEEEEEGRVGGAEAGGLVGCESKCRASSTWKEGSKR